MRNKRLLKLVKISVLSAMAFIIMFIEVSIPLFPEFLKIDLSDVPALLGAFSMGPIAGVAIELIKNVLHLLISKTAGVGELSNFLVGGIFVFAVGISYKNHKNKKGALRSLLMGVIVMGAFASILNLYVFLPLYETVLHFPIVAVVETGHKFNSAIKDVNTFIVFSILPFNILKGLIASGVTFIMYKKVSPILHK